MKMLANFSTLPFARIAVAAVLLTAASANAATPEQIEAAIRKGVAYLYKQQNSSGNWEKSQTKPETKTGSGADEGQWGGRTALATYALLAAGERPLDARIVKATDWLRTAPIGGFYAIGMRANVWLNLPETKENKLAMERDGVKLRTGVSRARENIGLYTYLGTAKNIDLSCSQYGVLGAWAASQRGQEFGPNYWFIVERAWRTLQQPEGGWSYRGRPNARDGETIQMTAAGVATLFITQEFVHADEGIEGTRGNVKDAFINKGLAWIAQNFPAALAKPMFYAMYGVERIGVASGLKYLGTIDWFQAGADMMVKTQRKDGSWASTQGTQIDTCFALLFLSRGRSPVMMNKLQYTIAAAKSDKEVEGNWNQRPRDVANATRWVEEKTERKLNWQSIDLNVATVDDLHDSSIAYMSGNQALNLKAADKAKLKQYIEEGGIVLGTADAGRPEFAKSFRALGHELFPEYEFGPLEDTNVLLSAEQFPAGQWKHKLRIEALGNKARIFMLLAPNEDLGRALQRRELNREEIFQFITNAFLYSVDKAEARFKGQTYIVRPDAAIKTDKSIKIARIKYKGIWDPEPAGWRRLAAVLHNDKKIDLDVQAVEPGKDSLEGYKIAYMTGTDVFTLTEAQREALKKFVAAGGLLLCDSCGGGDDFSKSMLAEFNKIWPGQASQLYEPLKNDDALYTTDPQPGLEPKYRTYALQKLGAEALHFRLCGLRIDGRLGVIYSNEDLSVGLVGEAVDGILGYQPATATALVQRLILLKNAGKI
ncbi:MAG: DUF4159 domain-containing protein [Tepidisphaeraceae bacterium]